MKEFKGTKGEWYYDGESQAIFHPTEIGSRLAVFYQTYSTNEYGSTYSTDEWRPNAALIASATDLLDKLQNIVNYLDGNPLHRIHPNTPLHVEAKMAIEKALTIKE